MIYELWQAGGAPKLFPTGEAIRTERIRLNLIAEASSELFAQAGVKGDTIIERRKRFLRYESRRAAASGEIPIKAGKLNEGEDVLSDGESMVTASLAQSGGKTMSTCSSDVKKELKGSILAIIAGFSMYTTAVAHDNVDDEGAGRSGAGGRR